MHAQTSNKRAAVSSQYNNLKVSVSANPSKQLTLFVSTFTPQTGPMFKIFFLIWRSTHSPGKHSIKLSKNITSITSHCYIISIALINPEANLNWKWPSGPVRHSHYDGACAWVCMHAHCMHSIAVGSLSSHQHEHQCSSPASSKWVT